MPDGIRLALLSGSLPRGLDFASNYLVEFEPQSLWYQASFTLAAQALAAGIKTDYHTFTRGPEDVKEGLRRLGADVGELMDDDRLRIWDSFTVQTKVGKAEKIGKISQTEDINIRSVLIDDWDRGAHQSLVSSTPESEMNRLHVDDNTSVLLQYNDERRVLEHFRTLTIPFARKVRIAAIHSALLGVYSDSFYRQFESFCDGVIEFRTREEGGTLVQMMRVKTMRAAPFEGDWKILTALGSGEIGLVQVHESRANQEERRLAAIMFTDTVGFTGLGQRNEELMMQLLQEQRRLLRPCFDRHRGREVKTTGDGFLVEFNSALEAVKCAGEIQSTLKDQNERRPEDRKILVRIGIHLGDVIHSGSDVAGDAVNVASRIEPLAPPGGVCVTGQVYESVANKTEYRFESIGTPFLKNVANPIEVYQISGLGLGYPPPPSARAEAKERLAILPLANISHDKADEYFAEGLTDELISSVYRMHSLHVIARTSVIKYKGSSKSIAEIGKELNVGSLLEGSVRKDGDKLRITVQLVDTSNEEPKWSQEYDRELKDVFSIQSDIAHNVAEALRVQVLGTAARGTTEPTSNMDAYVLYLRGRQHWNRRTKADLEEAVKLFEEALKIDPNYARAYAGLADAYAMLASYATEYLPPSVAYPKAKAAIQRALEVDPRLVEAHTSFGVVKFHYDWDWDGAEAEFRNSIGLGPSYAPAHQFYSDHLKALGRLDEALREVRKARELDPLSLPINSAVGHVLYLSRQYDAAIEQYRRVVELDPSFMQTHIWFGRPLLEKGMFEEALTELRTGVRLSGESNVSLGMLGHGLASAGKREEALEIVQKLKERSRTQYVSSYWIAAVYNGMKDREETVAWLRKAFDERSSWLVWCNVEPRFDWLRDDPEFAAVMAAMKFPRPSKR